MEDSKIQIKRDGKTKFNFGCCTENDVEAIKMILIKDPKIAEYFEKIVKSKYDSPVSLETDPKNFKK